MKYRIESDWFGSGGRITPDGFVYLAALLREAGYDASLIRRNGEVIEIEIECGDSPVLDSLWSELCDEMCTDESLVNLV